MQSKNKSAPTTKEREHIERVKELACSVDDAEGPSEVHEIRQGQWWTSIALCADCHRSERLGIHGLRFNWKIKKMDELDALGVTVRRLMTGA